MAKILFFFLAVFTVVFAQGDVDESYNVEALTKLTDGARKKILEISNVLNDAPRNYRELVAERFDCLKWEGVVQTNQLTKNTQDTTAKGLVKNKPYKSFECISNKSRDAFDKLNATIDRLPEDSEKVFKFSLNNIMPFKLLIPGLDKYVRDFQEAKVSELQKTPDEAGRKKILDEVEKKMKLLGGILDGVNARIENLGHSFFEIYVDFIFAKENALKKIQRDGTQNMLKCIA